MAITGSGTSTATVYNPSGSYTLAQLIAKYRPRLSDLVEDYLWSNDDLTECVDTIQKQLAVELNLFEDRATASICTVALVQGSGLVAVSPRIIKIKQAHIEGETAWLTLLKARDMDARYPPGWDAASITQDTPHTLVHQGVGVSKVYLYPPLDAVAGGTLNLVVYRLPLVDLDYTAHAGLAIEIDRYAHLITHGVLWQAYLKDGATNDPKKAEKHRVMWEGENGYGGDKEKIRVMVLREQPDECSYPHPGQM